MASRCNGRTKSGHRCRRRVIGQLCSLHKDQPDSSMIYVKNMTTVNCNDDCGISKGVVGKISRKEWVKIGQALKKYQPLTSSIEKDYTSGGHGCVLTFDLLRMYQNAKILTSYSDDLDQSFVDLLKEEVEGIEFCVTRGCSHFYRDKKGDIQYCKQPVSLERYGNKCKAHCWR